MAAIKQKKFKQLRGNSTLKANGKELVFKDGIADVTTVTDDIKALVKAGYLEEVKDGSI